MTDLCPGELVIQTLEHADSKADNREGAFMTANSLLNRYPSSISLISITHLPTSKVTLVRSSSVTRGRILRWVIYAVLYFGHDSIMSAIDPL